MGKQGCSNASWGGSWELAWPWTLLQLKGQSCVGDVGSDPSTAWSLKQAQAPSTGVWPRMKQEKASSVYCPENKCKRVTKDTGFLCFPVITFSPFQQAIWAGKFLVFCSNVCQLDHEAQSVLEGSNLASNHGSTVN